MAAGADAKTARRVDRELGDAVARVRRALEAGPCDYETLAARIAAERDAAMRAAGVADARPMSLGSITTALGYMSDVVAQYTGAKCRGPRGAEYGYLGRCTFELSPYGRYADDHPEVIRGWPGDGLPDRTDSRPDAGTNMYWLRCMFADIMAIAHRDHARRLTDAGGDPRPFRFTAADGAAVYEIAAARAAAAGIEPPPRPYFL